MYYFVMGCLTFLTICIVIQFLHLPLQNFLIKKKIVKKFHLQVRVRQMGTSGMEFPSLWLWECVCCMFVFTSRVPPMFGQRVLCRLRVYDCRKNLLKVFNQYRPIFWSDCKNDRLSIWFRCMIQRHYLIICHSKAVTAFNMKYGSVSIEIISTTMERCLTLKGHERNVSPGFY